MESQHARTVKKREQKNHFSGCVLLVLVLLGMKTLSGVWEQQFGMIIALFVCSCPCSSFFVFVVILATIVVVVIVSVAVGVVSVLIIPSH